MNMVGRTTAMTVISAFPRWQATRLEYHWALANFLRRRNRPTAAVTALTELSFIHFAHWSLFKPPSQGARTKRRRPYRYLLFESNFNGGKGQYIEAFSLVIPGAMHTIWGGAYGVPPPNPTKPFLGYIEEKEIPVAHYYCAYPEASTKMVRAALELKKRFDAFEQDTAGLGAELFATRYREFLTDVQGLL
jgi:hypothetical protein